ncbi:MAG: MBOAT family protein, partial [Lachnospiraceae bacterium]|nr:MBOAT family protein [Lachnospiraceae bacterium]
FDFSGYSDMARGIGFFFNIEIPVNFFSPYQAVNLVDFWKRWHITLTRFFTKYVYIPLGGSRKGTLRTYLNIFMIYLVSGIWHGAGWTYLCWGALHGVVYVLTRRFLPILERLPKAVSWFFNMTFFLVSLVLFRAESLGQAVLIFQKALGGAYTISSVPAAFAEQFRTPEFFYCLKLLPLDSLFGGAFTGAAACDILLLIGYMAAAWFMILCCRNVNETIERFQPTAARAVWISVLFLWSVVSFSEVSVFLYFNF